jgi:hypothetical protein
VYEAITIMARERTKSILKLKELTEKLEEFATIMVLKKFFENKEQIEFQNSMKNYLNHMLSSARMVRR